MNTLQCKHCTRFTAADVVYARVAGWRIYDGPTQGGGHLTDVVCPACAGVEEPPQPSWNVVCETCGYSYADEDFAADEALGEAGDALEIADDHQCEPQIVLISPEGSRHKTTDFTAAGRLKLRQFDNVVVLAGAS